MNLINNCFETTKNVFEGLIINCFGYEKSDLNDIYEGFEDFKNVKYRPSAYEVAFKIVKYPLIILSFNFIHSKFSSYCFRILPRSPLLWATAAIILSLIVDILPLLRRCHINKLIAVNPLKKKVMLICEASDRYGAFRMTPNITKILKKFLNDHSIVYKKIGSVEDINSTIQEIKEKGQNITNLWIQAHGGPDHMELGNFLLRNENPNPSLEYEEAMKFVELFFPSQSVNKIDFSGLDKKANIILLSCSSGGVPKYTKGLNIAEWIQYYAGPNRKVFAPREDIVAEDVNHNDVLSGHCSEYRFLDFTGMDMTADISYENVVKKMKENNLRDLEVLKKHFNQFIEDDLEVGNHI